MEQQQQYEDVFGTARIGGGDYQKAKKIETGITEARLIPPVKSQKATGRWSLYHRIHYGYYGVNRRDPTSDKLWAKPFLCIEEKDMRLQMITKACPKCEQVKDKKAALDEREAEIRKELKGRPEQDIKGTFKSDPVYDTLNKWRIQHNIDGHYYVNVKYVDGSVGCMKIPSKSKKALDEQIKNLLAKKIDPFALNAGVFFKFSRQGEKINTEYSVSVSKEEVAGPGGELYERNKTAPLSGADVEQIKTKAMDLLTAHGATVLTEAQIKALVECDEDPATVDAIFDQVQKATPAEQVASSPAAKPTPKPVQTPAPAPAAKPVVKTAPAPAPTSAPAPVGEDDEEAALLKKLEETRARKAAEKAAAQAAQVAQAMKPAPKPAPAPVQVQNIDEIDPDSFIEEFGDPGSN